MRFPLTLISLAVAASGAGEPIRTAAEARIWLQVPLENGPLKDFRVSCGEAGPPHWEKNQAVRERSIDYSFPIHWWSWTAAEIRFTPSTDATVILTLSGPWSAGKHGELWRQEVLWDDIETTGARIINGDFETAGNPAPAGWSSPWSPYLSADSWPVAGSPALQGSRLAASWHNRPLTQEFQVSAGKPVTITLHAKAAPPEGFIAPRRLTKNSPAHQAVARMRRGVNLGNGWESPPGPNSWGLQFTTADVDRIADEGFDHIRIPVAWHHHLDSEQGKTRISPKLLRELEPVIRRALDRKLVVLLNWHHFNDLTRDLSRNQDRFLSGWQAIAGHFAAWPENLFFELLNEPCDQLTTEACGPLYHKAIRVIRTSNPRRILIASPGQWGQAAELDRLLLPDDDDRIVVTIHCYAPFHFTHQGAGWVGLQELRGITYPGPPSKPFALPDSFRGNPAVRRFVEDYNLRSPDENPCSAISVRRDLDSARRWSDHFGRPVHLGEFGAHSAGDDLSRARYLRDVSKLAEERGMPWTLWEWKAGFGYWDTQKNRPRFRESLIR